MLCSNTSVSQLKNRNNFIAVPVLPPLTQSGYLAASYLFLSAPAGFRTVLFSFSRGREGTVSYPGSHRTSVQEHARELYSPEPQHWHSDN